MIYNTDLDTQNPDMRAPHEMTRKRVHAFIDNWESENERIIRDNLARAGWRPPGEASAHKLNADQTVAVATDVFWNEDMAACPRGCKLQLLGAGGVASYGSYHGDPFWVGWAPVPKRRRKV
ncbi:MAG: hypothetical protein ACTS8S_00425 [Giesbergeria sp.]